MKLILSFSMLGAMVGGIPGAIAALLVTGRSGPESVLGVTVFLSIGFSYACMLIAKSTLNQKELLLVEMLVPIALGLVWGGIGYVWLCWALRHLDPPL